MATLYFNVKGGLQTGNIILDAATGNVTGIGNIALGNLATANFFSGDGSALSGLSASNLASGTISSGILGNSTVYVGTTSIALNRTSGTQSLTGIDIDGSANYATYAGTVTTADQPNITSTGTLSSLGVTGNITAGNISSQGAINSTGNVTAPFFIGDVVGNISGTITVPGNNTAVLFNQTGNAGASDALKFNYSSNVLTVSGNLSSQNANLGNLVVANYVSGDGSLLTSITGANVTGTVANATYATSAGSATTAGTVTTAAQPNITSVGSLSSLTVTGLTTATGGVKVGNLQDTAGTNTIQLLNSDIIVTGNISAGGGGTGNVTATYYIGNGSALTSITGANVTGTVSAATTAGTVTTAAQPNITSVGTLVNTTMGSANSLSGGNLVSATYLTGTLTTQAQPNITSVGTLMGLGITGNLQITGNINATGNLNYQNVSDLVVGDPLIYLGANNTGNLYDLGFVASYNDGTYAHTGLARNHNDGVWTIFDDVVAEPTTTIDWGNAVIGGFRAGNIRAGNISGANLISANYFSGNGSALSAITGANITGTVSSATTAATVTTAAQPNITSTGTLAGVTATGTVNLTGASNVSLGPVANVHISGGTSGYLLTTNGSGTLTWEAPASTTAIVNGTSNVSISSSGGNVTAGVGGTANVLVLDAGGANVTGNLSVTGTFTAGNLTTSGSSGNISGANYIIANYFSGDGSALTNLNASNLASGTISSGILGNSTVYVGTTSLALNRTSGSQSLTGITSIDGYAATVSGAAQANITSVGTLNGLTVTGTVNATGASNVSLGPVANVHISGGTSGYLLTTNGSGTLSWAAPASTTSIINGTSNVNIGTSGGNVTTSVGGTANVIVATSTGANFAGYINLTGNLTAANASLGNLVVANFFSGNGSLLTSITGANVTGTVANATYATSAGTATSAGSATTAGTVTTNAQPNITSVGTLVSTTMAANATLTFSGTGSQISGANLISATNLTGTLTTAAQPNITSVGTLTSVDVTGTATVGNVNITGGILSNRANVSVGSNTVIDEFAPGTYRTAKYVVSASNANGYQSAEIILVHNGSTAYISIYGSVCSNATADIVEFSSNINGVSGNVTVYATGSSATLNLVATYLKT